MARRCLAHYEQNLSTIPQLREALTGEDVLLTGSHEYHFKTGQASTTLYVVKRSPPAPVWDATDDELFNLRLYREPGRQAGWSIWDRDSFAERKVFSSWSRDRSYWILDIANIEAYSAPEDNVYTADVRQAMMAIIAELWEKERPGAAEACRKLPSLSDPDWDLSVVWRALHLP